MAGACGTVGVAVGAGARKSWSFRIAELVGVPRSRNGLAGQGCWSSWTRSSMAAVARSADDVAGMVNCEGRKCTVLPRLMPLVLGM